MRPVPEAIPDTNWLIPGNLYFSSGRDLRNRDHDRPIYQGDVFEDVPVPKFPKKPPEEDCIEVPLSRGLVMVVPHPCQCYHGDRPRPNLTVAPLKTVEDYDNFRPDGSGAKDKFALPELPHTVDGEFVKSDFVADFGRLISVPNKWLAIENRVACLSHQGLGLLGKRILGFQLRDTTISLTGAMAYTQEEWNESFLMQAWVRQNGTLRGFTNWLTTEQVIEGIGDGNPVVPRNYRAAALDALLEAITGEPVEEPN